MKRKELLGVILVREGMLSSAHLQQALDRQAALRLAGKVMPLGLVLMQLGLASEPQVRHALKLQQRLLVWPPEGKPPWQLRLIEDGVLAPSLLVMMMDEHDRTGEPLEQLLVERQMVTPAVIEYLRLSIS